MIIRRLIVPLTVAVFTAHAGQLLAQGAFPAPLPNQTVPLARENQSAPLANDPAFPSVNGSAPVASVGARPSASFPVNGAAPLSGGFQTPTGPPMQAGGPADDCMKQFMPLREEAEKRGKLIKAASDHHASPQEACKLIRSFGQAEVKMIAYVTGHSAKCGIPAQISEQLKNGHKNTENMLQKVCAAAQQAEQRGPAGPSLSEVLGSAAELPEATPTKKGGSTFDTLNGNVLTR